MVLIYGPFMCFYIQTSHQINHSNSKSIMSNSGSDPAEKIIEQFPAESFDIIDPQQIASIIAAKLSNAIDRPALYNKAKTIPAKVLQQFNHLVETEGKATTSSKIALLTDLQIKVLAIEKHMEAVNTLISDLANAAETNSSVVEAQEFQEIQSQQVNKKKKGGKGKKPKKKMVNSITQSEIKLRQALKVYNQGNYQQTIHLFKEYCPDDDFTKCSTSDLYVYASSLFNLEKYDQASIIFKKVYNRICSEPTESLEQKNDQLKTVLSHYIECLKIKGNSKFIVEWLQKSIDLYNESARTVPLTDEERQQLAEDYNSLAFYQEKLNQSNNKDRHKPNETIVKYYLKSLDYKARVETHANLAELYFRMGNYAGSAKHYKQVIQLSEVEKTEVEDFEREQLIKSYFKLKMYSEAKQEFLNLTRPSIEMLELEIEIQKIFGDDYQIEMLNQRIRTMKGKHAK